MKLPRSLRKLRKLPFLKPSRNKKSAILNPFAKVSLNTPDTQRFLVILNWLGYILLFVSAVDYFLILYPPQLTNPNWELQTFISMVNNSWLLLLALILVFIPNRRSMRRLEAVFLRMLRWSLLLGGILFFLLIPLTLVNANRINQNTIGQLVRQQVAQQEQLSEYEELLQSGNISPFQIQAIRERLTLGQIPESLTLQEALLQEIEERKEQLKQEVESVKRSNFRQLARQVGRNGLAGVLIGAFLIRLWWEGRWVKPVKRESINETQPDLQEQQ